MRFDVSNPLPYFFPLPKPFKIEDEEFKIKINKIQEDYLWRMRPEEEENFYIYLNTLSKILEKK